VAEFTALIAAYWRPAAFVLGGLIIGIVIERLVLRRLRKAARKTTARWDDTTVDALRGAPILWCTAAGIYLAALTFDLSDFAYRILGLSLTVLVIFSITLVVARVAASLVALYSQKSAKGIPASSLIQTLVKVLVLVLGGLVILQALDLPIAPVITSLGIGGIAVALALQPTLSNVFAGFQIIAAGQVSVGDYVALETGDEGYVVDIKWRNTTIQSLYDDSEIVVPNSKMADSIVTDFHLPRRAVWLRIPVGVSYGSDLEQVERVTLEVARAVSADFAGQGPLAEPVMRYQAFGDSSVDLSVRIQVSEFQRQFRVRHEFIKQLHRRFREEGITIPFPIRTLHGPAPVPIEGVDGSTAARDAGANRHGEE
jgi:small-conductance mechanosensitive channel